MSTLRQHSVRMALLGTFWSLSLHAEGPAVRGYWLEPSGSIIHIAPCDHGLCLQIAALPPGPHPDADVHNPDRSLRSRPLCGLRIGENFIERDAQHAEGGHLYDPKDGRTYRGSMTAEGDLLELRGYVGWKLFGRTETWKRTQGPPVRCGVT